MRLHWLLAAVVATTACTGAPAGPEAAPTGTTSTATPAEAPTVSLPGTAVAPSTPSPPPSPSPTGSDPTPSTTPPATVVPAPGTAVHMHLESRVEDVSTAAFEDAVLAILTDPRGWTRAGFSFPRGGSRPAPYTVVLAEPAEVDELCLPLDTEGTWSCQNGPMVALNADRWRTATSTWQGTRADYRRMLVNHEVGHLLHLHHPVPQCPALDLPAPVMAQQSSGAAPCRENPWPLQWEVDLAAERREPLAPPATHDTRDHQPSPPPATE